MDIRSTKNLCEQIRSLADGPSRTQILGAKEDFLKLTFLELFADPRFDQHLVIVLPRHRDFSRWLDFFDLSLEGIKRHDIPASIMPVWSGWGADRYVNPSLTRRQRQFCLANLTLEKSSITITTLSGMCQRTSLKQTLVDQTQTLRVSQEVDLEDLIQNLEDLSYNRRASVDEEGTYSVKGGIVDVFPLNMNDPVRIEFMGDEIMSIRTFAVSTQRSIRQIEVVEVFPALDGILDKAHRKEQAQRLFDYLIDSGSDTSDREGMVSAFQSGALFAGADMFFPLWRREQASAWSWLPDQSLVVFPQGLESCLEAYDEHLGQCYQAHKNDIANGKAALPVEQHFLNPEEVDAAISKMRLLEFGNPYNTTGTPWRVVSTGNALESPLPVETEMNPFDRWFPTVEFILQSHQSVVVLCGSVDQMERASNLFSHRGILPIADLNVLMRLHTDEFEPGTLYLGLGELSGPTWINESKVLLVPDRRVFGGERKRRKAGSKKLQNYLSSFKDLKIGDLVVHVMHGIGRYTGMKSLMVGGLANDFLVIEYAGGDKIYLPVDRLSLLQRYSSGGEGTPRVDKLGGQNWDKRKSSVRKAIRDMAEELLAIQARRSVASGFSYRAPDDTYLKFENNFPYDETEDQIRTLMDVESDLRGQKPMDRLVCGDVGFGKTEIALRAAFRCVLEGRQVLVLVPTTVLCYQHYRTFKSRLEDYGVVVGMLNRFVGRLESKTTLQGLEEGKVDILVGTHRILSKDIKAKNLGMIVVDEEQRFGVSHKEKLKRIKAGADVMTLSATPIPRTLHMAMVGLRDISLITTPPQDRLSVKTYVAKFDETLVRDAILQEVRRGGQVFFVHNRVEDIEEVRMFIKSLVPHLDVRVGHGQMRENQLEKVIIDFIDQKFPVFVCTTIIESGIDMPNVNTLIVNRADRFGLSQLYQLRGRVGRSNIQAYAYFLTPDEGKISEDAKKRLDILAAHQELGAGFQIASHDLELRGAGNLLGGEQSGHASHVGLELYTEMLEQAIQELQGNVVREKVDTELKLPISAVIPSIYISDEDSRLRVYKSLFGCQDGDELTSVKKDIVDRYGQAPKKLEVLFALAGLKIQLRNLNATRIAASSGKVVEVSFQNLEDVTIEKIFDCVRRHPDRYKLAPGNRLLLFMKIGAQPGIDEQQGIVRDISALLAPLE